MNRTIEFNDETIQQLFGYEDAESEPIARLKEYFFKTSTYERVRADLPVRILVGHKGTGKSALFKVAMSEDRDNGNLPIMIRPDDIAELGRSDENFLLKIKQWKWGLTKIIGEKVLSEFNLNPEVYISKLGQFGLKIITFLSDTIKVVKDNVSMNGSQAKMCETFLKSHKIIVYLDDLDRGWEGKSDDISRISALLNSIRDMANENPGLQFKVSLRSDVYYLVRTSDESTDKIEGAVVWYKWTLQEILVMLIKRVQSFLGNPVDEEKLLTSPQRHISSLLDEVIEHKFYGWKGRDEVPMYQVLLSMTRKRPRDIVKLCTMAAHEAQSHHASKINSDHLQAIFEDFSQGRIQDTINEYRSELPKISDLLFGMRPTTKEREAGKGFIYTTAELKKKLNNLKQNKVFVFKSGRASTPEELINFMYKINFLNARKTLENGKVQRKYFEENRYLMAGSVDFGYEWEVHLAFRWALQPENIDDILRSISSNLME